MMASYFMPSFFQKRLLKYALSRLGLVDTEALDPDNLGIRWGQRSTIELRDIGLKLEVSGCIDPPQVAGRPFMIIEHATIEQCRLTVYIAT